MSASEKTNKCDVQPHCSSFCDVQQILTCVSLGVTALVHFAWIFLRFPQSSTKQQSTLDFGLNRNSSAEQLKWVKTERPCTDVTAHRRHLPLLFCCVILKIFYLYSCHQLAAQRLVSLLMKTTWFLQQLLNNWCWPITCLSVITASV